MTKRTDKIIYLASTVFVTLFSAFGAWGLLALPFFIDTVNGMGYPRYFRITLAIFKILGGVVILLPVPTRVKEWAYAGIGINVISAIISFCAIEAPAASFISPVIALLALIISYVYFCRTTQVSPLGTFDRHGREQ
ncbi:DoxX family protein [Chitinophaga ginsengisoli]|uniref:DoxX-like protein n=1 Tax=Chitinophaga ginsengisoli TaxID=363837 RepID=A0A2P8GI54_9BACT|nr:DoxX family protein [Chitinophaga ginsengisoli]PSL33610.1 DoxX-like protein [Chitinophaga ginsengisoli]